ncbi:VOC family protein [candidate division KSB1 bacterium]
MNIETDTDKAEKSGANIIKGVTEVPNIGKFSIIQDPTGAVFCLWQCLEKNNNFTGGI